ncbi:hypothetical protein [Streptomyces rhizosphaericus]|uniref:Uncharacterized protein n=1 Tax=Streptomyces rhizosphaericus TaxID=114699 RepID=A0A6G4AP95_9ACTN|nr:hypothetical protein [Streptomyces rhizosphaericus]NEW75058.1 hypothetical protein [Streptomyces rhizosphaericus]
MGAARMAWRRAYNFWSHHPATDFILAGVAILSAFFWQQQHFLASHDSDQRMSIYATIASVAAIVGGFGTAAISQYATSSGMRMAVLRQAYGIHLRRNWVSLLTSMLLVSGGCLGVMVGDTGETIGWPGWVTEWLVFLGVFRALRLVWLFRLLIDVSDFDANYQGRGETIEVVDIPHRDSRSESST